MPKKCKDVITMILDMMRLSTSTEEAKIRLSFAKLWSKQRNARLLKFVSQVAIFLSDANIVQKWRSEEMIESQQWIPEADDSGLKNPSLRQILLSDYLYD